MPAESITTSESLMLDVLRTVAAMVVAFGHLTQGAFSTNWPDLTPMAVFAVTVFFVLSGFVIRSVTCRRPATLSHYLGDRASRIYSVAIPALLLTLAVHYIAQRYPPSFSNYWDDAHPLRIVLLNLCFCGELWGHIRHPLSDAPYWSVSYEVAYYLLYGCFFYLAGKKKWLFILAIALFFGPRVLFLAPLWIAGCIVHDCYQRWNDEGTTLKYLIWMSVAVLVSAATYFTLQHLLAGKTLPPAPHLLTYLARTSMITPKIYALGIAWVVVFMWLLLLARKLTLQPKSRGARITRFISEGTFPIYLIHYPLYVLAAMCISYNHASVLPKMTLFLTVIVIGIFAGHPANIFKRKLRAMFSLNLSKATVRSQS
jgi:peptidoglycan/LPS O-acetylase OafA/YrhL